jgi:hypothetical protein
MKAEYSMLSLLPSAPVPVGTTMDAFSWTLLIQNDNVLVCALAAVSRQSSGNRVTADCQLQQRAAANMNAQGSGYLRGGVPEGQKIAVRHRQKGPVPAERQARRRAVSIICASK